ncbi:MAG: DUF2007 domain-containing protein [Planctomycetota bacterium]
MGRWVEVDAARDIPHAYLLKGILEEAGIEVAVGNENLQIGLGELPLGLPTAPRILVDESQAARAARILKELEESAGRERGFVSFGRG